MSVGGDPHEEVLLPSDIDWKEDETSFSYLGDDGKIYIICRDSPKEVLCNLDHDSLVAQPEHPDPDMSGSQLEGHPEQGEISVNPDSPEQFSLYVLMSQPEENLEQGIIVTNPAPPPQVNSRPPELTR